MARRWWRRSRCRRQLGPSARGQLRPSPRPASERHEQALGVARYRDRDRERVRELVGPLAANGAPEPSGVAVSVEQLDRVGMARSLTRAAGRGWSVWASRIAPVSAGQAASSAAPRPPTRKLAAPDASAAARWPPRASACSPLRSRATGRASFSSRVHGPSRARPRRHGRWDDRCPNGACDLSYVPLSFDQWVFERT